MSFYRTLLEDEVNVLNDDNDGSKQAMELMKMIDDQKVNDDEVDPASEAKYDFDGSANDITNEMYMAIAEAEMDWNAFMQEAGVKELGDASRGIYTEGVDSVKNFFETCKTKIKDFFKKVWQVIQRWASNITSTAASDKKFASKYASRIKEGYNLYKNDKSIEKIKGYPFSDLNKTFDSFIAGDHLVKSENEESAKGDLGKLRSKFAGNSSDAPNFRDDVMNNLRGSKEKKELNMTAEEVIKQLQDESITKKAVNKAMQQAKKEFKSAIKEVDKLQRDAEKAARSDNSERAAEGKVNTKKYTVMATSIREQLKVLQIVRSCLLKAIGERKRQTRKLGNAYVRMANKDKHKGFSEASYGFLSGMNLI